MTKESYLRLTSKMSTSENKFSSLCLLRKHIQSTKSFLKASFLPVFSILSDIFSAFGQALDRLVTVSYMHCCTSTSVLSTSCSLRGLRLATGDLILRGASRLDAFSVYPVRTWLLCRAFGNTTDTPAVRPPRSSRTKGSSSQISCARAG